MVFNIGNRTKNILCFSESTNMTLIFPGFDGPVMERSITISLEKFGVSSLIFPEVALCSEGSIEVG